MFLVEHYVYYKFTSPTCEYDPVTHSDVTTEIWAQAVPTTGSQRNTFACPATYRDCPTANHRQRSRAFITSQSILELYKWWINAAPEFVEIITHQTFPYIDHWRGYWMESRLEDSKISRSLVTIPGKARQTIPWIISSNSANLPCGGVPDGYTDESRRGNKITSRPIPVPVMIDLSLAEMMSRRLLAISIRIKQRRSRVRVWAAQSCPGRKSSLAAHHLPTGYKPSIPFATLSSLSPQDQVIKAAAVVLLRNADGRTDSRDQLIARS